MDIQHPGVTRMEEWGVDGPPARHCEYEHEVELYENHPTEPTNHRPDENEKGVG